MVKERPILFSTAMVQALLEGRKLQTRRANGLDTFNESPSLWNFSELYVDGKGDLHGFFQSTEDEDLKKKLFGARCPYGKPGDILWVRETWLEQKEFPGQILFKAGIGEVTNKLRIALKEKWKPSIHMPKDTARIWLEVTEVRVERLQDISEEDAKAEGAHNHLKHKELELLKGLDWEIKRPFENHQFGFLSIWCQINGLKSWELNPWVWVVSFKILSTTGKVGMERKEAAV